jgi:hypothetical protein
VLNHAGELRRLGPVLLLVLLNWRFVRDSHTLWGSVGYVLVNSGWRGIAALWLRNYEHRELSAWMLLNLGIALRDLGFLARARRVSERALTLPPDHTRGAHLTLLAFDAAVLGQTEEGEQWLSDVGAKHAAPFFEKLHDLAAAMLELQRAPAPERSMAAAHAWHCLSALHLAPVLRFFSPETIQWRRAGRRIGRSTRSVSGLVKGYAATGSALTLTAGVLVVVATGHGSTLIGPLFWLVFWYVIGRFKR